MRFQYIIFFSLFVFSFMACQQADQKVEKPVVAIDSVDYEAKLNDMGVTLKVPGAPVANYVNIVQTGNLLFLAGKGPRLDDGTYITGKVGAALTQEQG